MTKGETIESVHPKQQKGKTAREKCVDAEKNWEADYEKVLIDATSNLIYGNGSGFQNSCFARWKATLAVSKRASKLHSKVEKGNMAKPIIKNGLMFLC